MERFPVTITRAAGLLNVSQQSVRNWISQFKIPTKKGPRGTLISVEVLDTKLVRCRRFGEPMELISAIRKAHNEIQKYQADGGVRNLEPERVKLDALWYQSLTGCRIDHAELAAILTFCAEYVPALSSFELDLELSA